MIVMEPVNKTINLLEAMQMQKLTVDERCKRLTVLDGKTII